MFKINPNLNSPLYLQISMQIKRLVALGVLKPGERLPSVRDLGKSLTLNPNTIVKAYDELEKEGLVVRQQGRGTFVAEDIFSRDYDLKKETLKKLLRQFLVEAYALNIPKEKMKEIILENIDEWYLK